MDALGDIWPLLNQIATAHGRIADALDTLAFTLNQREARESTVTSALVRRRRALFTAIHTYYASYHARAGAALTSEDRDAYVLPITKLEQQLQAFDQQYPEIAMLAEAEDIG